MSSSQHALTVTFLGTGTSVGVPMPGCECAVCRSTDPKDKRLRASMLIRWDDHAVIFDCGPDFRYQALRAKLTNLDAIFMTHDHADHVLGLDDTRNFSSPEHPLKLFCDTHTQETLTRIFPYAFQPEQEHYWVPTLNVIHAEPGRPIELNGLNFTPFVAQHGVYDVLTWLVTGSDGEKILAYATDVSALPDDVIDAFSHVELLVMGLLRDRPHPKHFTRDQALAAVDNIAPKQTRFVHMTHELFHEKTNRELPANHQLAFDGETVTLNR